MEKDIIRENLNKFKNLLKFDLISSDKKLKKKLKEGFYFNRTSQYLEIDSKCYIDITYEEDKIIIKFNQKNLLEVLNILETYMLAASHIGEYSIEEIKPDYVNKIKVWVNDEEIKISHFENLLDYKIVKKNIKVKDVENYINEGKQIHFIDEDRFIIEDCESENLILGEDNIIEEENYEPIMNYLWLDVEKTAKVLNNLNKINEIVLKIKNKDLEKIIRNIEFSLE